MLIVTFFGSYCYSKTSYIKDFWHHLIQYATICNKCKFYINFWPKLKRFLFQFLISISLRHIEFIEGYIQKNMLLVIRFTTDIFLILLFSFYTLMVFIIMLLSMTLLITLTNLFSTHFLYARIKVNIVTAIVILALIFNFKSPFSNHLNFLFHFHKYTGLNSLVNAF